MLAMISWPLAMALLVPHQRRAEQVEIRGVGQQAAGAARSSSGSRSTVRIHKYWRGAPAGVAVAGPGTDAKLDRALVHELPQARRQAVEKIASPAASDSGSSSGDGTCGIGELVLEAGLRLLEGRRAVEDLLAVLDRRDAAAGEAVAVAAAIDEVDDRRVEVAAPQEIGVQRMHHAAGIDRRVGGLQRLAQHLAAVDLRAADVAARAAKDVDLEPFELQQLQQTGEALVHVR